MQNGTYFLMPWIDLVRSVFSFIESSMTSHFILHCSKSSAQFKFCAVWIKLYSKSVPVGTSCVSVCTFTSLFVFFSWKNIYMGYVSGLKNPSASMPGCDILLTLVVCCLHSFQSTKSMSQLEKLVSFWLCYWLSILYFTNYYIYHYWLRTFDWTITDSIRHSTESNFIHFGKFYSDCILDFLS